MLVPPILDRYSNTLRLKDHYEWARKVYTQYRYEIIEWNTRAIAPFNHTVWCCQEWKELQGWLAWVNRNIVINLGLDSRETVGVKLRIATCMLNKLTSIDEITKIEIHSNLTRNIWYEQDIIDVEDLPFQL